MKDLDPFFFPRSVAVVGASAGPFRFGGASFLNYLLESRFHGRIYPVNPRAVEVQGLKAYPDLVSLPEVPDLALVCVPASKVPSVLLEAARVGLQHIHIVSAGFAETDTPDGRALEEEIISIARRAGLLVMGPNGMGPYCPSSGLTLWGAIPGLDGPVGIISQSGAMTQRLTEYLCSLGVGVHMAASIGNGTVLDAMDLLDYMTEREEIRVLGLYLEGTRDGRRLLHTVRRVNRVKPLVFLKGGRSKVGAATAVSHTGGMAGSSVLWEAFSSQTGVVEVQSLHEWADAIVALALLPPPGGNGVFIVGGGGGNSVLAADACIGEGLCVPALAQKSLQRLRELTPRAGSIAGNPLDLWMTYQDPGCLADVLEVGDEDPGVRMILVERLIPRKAFHMPSLPDHTADVIHRIRGRPRPKPTAVIVETEGGDPELAAEGARLRAEFCRAGIPAYPSMTRAARALARLYRYEIRCLQPSHAKAVPFGGPAHRLGHPGSSDEGVDTSSKKD